MTVAQTLCNGLFSRVYGLEITCQKPEGHDGPHGYDLEATRLPLFPEWEAAQRAKLAGKPKGGNPCIALFGRGPEGATCGGCVNLKRITYHTRRYYKCQLRTQTHGAATDHRVRWPACARFETEAKEMVTHEQET